jgi:hypothetical protein
MGVTGILGAVLNSALDGIQTLRSHHGNLQSVQNEFQQLGQDLKAGNVTEAQQDYSTIQQNLQQQSSGQVHHHHHLHLGGGQQTSQLAQEFASLGQALAAGDLQAAQSAFATLQQNSLQFGAAGNSNLLLGSSTSSSSSSNSSTPGASGILNVTA